MLCILIRVKIMEFVHQEDVHLFFKFFNFFLAVNKLITKQPTSFDIQASWMLPFNYA